MSRRDRDIVWCTVWWSGNWASETKTYLNNQKRVIGALPYLPYLYELPSLPFLLLSFFLPWLLVLIRRLVVLLALELLMLLGMLRLKLLMEIIPCWH